MNKDHDKQRRQFLRNTSLAALASTLLPGALGAKTGSSANKPVSLLECDPTTLDYYGEGPFYTENPPKLQNNQLADPNEPGERMIISGRVFNLDCTEAIPNAKVDVWHASDAGAYDNTGYNLRGVVYSNAQGFYMFETIKPGKYLNGAQFRPSHIHFKITPPGFPTITTQLYFEGDTSIANDAAASITSGQYDATHRIIPLEKNNEGVQEGTWDIVVSGEGVPTGTSDIHLDKGMIYDLSPNPFSDQVEIKYGIFRKSNVSLLVYNIHGQLVATLEERELSPEKYTAIWSPESSLAAGHYFIALKVNELQVHYLKAFLTR